MENKPIQEDFTAPGGQYMQLTGTTEGPKKVNLTDILKFQKYLEDELHRAPKVLPAPMSHNLLDSIADLYVKTCTIQSELIQVLQNPLVVDNKKVMKHLKLMYKKFSKIKLVIKSISQDLESLDISKD
jgi:hypothetical protein